MNNTIIIDLKNNISINNVYKALVDFNEEKIPALLDFNKVEVLEKECTRMMDEALGFKVALLIDHNGVDKNNTNNLVACVLTGKEFIPSKMVIVKRKDGKGYLPLNDKEVNKVYKYIDQTISAFLELVRGDEMDYSDLDDTFENYEGLNKYELEVKVEYDNFNPKNPIKGCYWDSYPLYNVPIYAYDIDAPQFKYLEGIISIDEFNEEEKLVIASFHFEEGIKEIFLKIGESKDLSFSVKVNDEVISIKLNIAFKYHNYTKNYDKVLSIETKSASLDDYLEINGLNTKDSEVYNTYFENILIDKVDEEEGYVRLFYMLKGKEELYHFIPVYYGIDNVCKFTTIISGKKEEVTRTIKIRER